MRIPDWRWILRWKVLYLLQHGRLYGSDYETAVRRVIVPLSGNVFWDVGANTGYYALRLAPKFGRVMAFEPNPTAAEILRQKIAKTHVRNVAVVPLALTDSVGRSRLHLVTRVRKRSVGSSNSLITDHPAHRTDSQKKGETISSSSIEVETTTVDSMLSDRKIDLMKIDVEGAEFMVLAGARNALSQGRVHWLVIELHDKARKDELDSLLKSYGYRTEWLDDDPVGGISHVLGTCDGP